MKLAVLSDIHGNWPALAATAADIDAWRPDVVLVTGDVVNDGPRNPACWDYVAQRRQRDGWLILRGNHEEYVAEWRDPAMPRQGPAYDLIRLSRWTYPAPPPVASARTREPPHPMPLPVSTPDP